VIEEIYRSTFETVRRAAGRVLREPADRDGVVQQVYTELVGSRRMRESYAGGDLGAWLGSIARHRAIDFARRERRLVNLSPAQLNGEGGDVSGRGAAEALDDFRRDLQAFAGRLDPQRRRVLELRFVAGLTQVEAAAQLGMPRSTLEDWERQIKKLLQAHLLGEDEPAQPRKAIA
jgi:RNA polymerase sigma factor (sigma-70 family)